MGVSLSLFGNSCFVNIDSLVGNAVEMLAGVVDVGCVEYLLVEEDRNEKFVVKLSVCV